MKQLLILLLVLGFQSIADGSGFKLPDSWGENQELLVKTKGEHSGVIHTIRLSQKNSYFEENLDGNTINVPFDVHQNDLNTLLLFLKDRGFNKLKSKKLKGAIFDKNLSMIYWLDGGKVVFSIGYNAGVEVHSRSQKTFQSILLHLIQFTERYTEKKRIKVQFFLDQTIKSSLQDFSYKISGNGMRGWFSNQDIPSSLSFHLFPGNYTVRFMLQNSEKGISGQSPETIWAEFEVNPSERNRYILILDKGKIRLGDE